MKKTYEFNFEDKFSTDAIEDLPEFIRGKIKSSQEYLAKITEISEQRKTQGVTELPVDDENPEDDLPF